MLKRVMIVLSLLVALVVGLEPLSSVHSTVMTGTELAMLEAAPTTQDFGTNQDRGNRLVRVLKAPFKAIGRLFGRGRKDDNKLHRLTEKDVKKFESSPLTRVVDATSVPSAETPNPEMGASELLERGRALLDEGKLNEAIAELSLTASKDPKSAEAHNLLGVAYHRKGMVEMARRSFETSLKLDKKNSQTLNNLGYLLYTNSDYKRALKHLKKAVLLAPDDARILNNLALTQSQLGKFDDAYKTFARAGGEIEGRLNVANRLEIAGRHEEARKHYEAARLHAEARRQTDASAQDITVVMEIENGRVKYASVENRRPGLAAHEATALRIARERRYPANKSGPESIKIRVSAAPAS